MRCINLLQDHNHSTKFFFWSLFLSFQPHCFQLIFRLRVQPKDKKKYSGLYLHNFFLVFCQYGMNNCQFSIFLLWRNILYFEDPCVIYKYKKHYHQFQQQSKLWIICNNHHRTWRKFHLKCLDQNQLFSFIKVKHNSSWGLCQTICCSIILYPMGFSIEQFSLEFLGS